MLKCFSAVDILNSKVMKLPGTLQTEIVNFLKSLPNIDRINGRKALILSAGLDVQLKEQISFEGPLAEFALILVQTLLEYGRMEDGRYALEAILEATLGIVGSDRQNDCNRVLQKLRKHFKHHHTNSSGQENSTAINTARWWDRKLVFLLLSLAILSTSSIVILVRNRSAILAIFQSSRKEGSYYAVKIVLPSKMSGADIYVDGQAANILKYTPLVVIVQVEEKQTNYQFIAQKAKERCSKTQLIQENDATIYICQ